LRVKNTAGSKDVKWLKFLKKLESFMNKESRKSMRLMFISKTFNPSKTNADFSGKYRFKELELRINNLNPIYFDKIGLVITYRILRGVLEECLRYWKVK
jgi:hypothetical protein